MRVAFKIVAILYALVIGAMFVLLIYQDPNSFNQLTMQKAFASPLNLYPLFSIISIITAIPSAVFNIRTFRKPQTIISTDRNLLDAEITGEMLKPPFSGSIIVLLLGNLIFSLTNLVFGLWVLFKLATELIEGNHSAPEFAYVIGLVASVISFFMILDSVKFRRSIGSTSL